LTPVEDFRSGRHTRARGRSAEADGALWLEKQGYSILDRNVSLSFGEIDVVALDGDTLCFVEIKARSSRRHGGAAYAVAPGKQRQLVRLARVYLARRPFAGPCRFDVLAMDDEDGCWAYTLFRNAFEAG